MKPETLTKFFTKKIISWGFLNFLKNVKSWGIFKEKLTIKRKKEIRPMVNKTHPMNDVFECFLQKSCSCQYECEINDDIRY